MGEGIAVPASVRLARFKVSVQREDIVARQRALNTYAASPSASLEERSIGYLTTSVCVQYDRTLAGDALGYRQPDIVAAVRRRFSRRLPKPIQNLPPNVSGR